MSRQLTEQELEAMELTARYARPGVPTLYAGSTQEAIDVGLNAFAVHLIAESFAFERAKWGEGGITCFAVGKDGLPVYVTVSSHYSAEAVDQALLPLALAEIRALKAELAEVRREGDAP